MSLKFMKRLSLTFCLVIVTTLLLIPGPARSQGVTDDTKCAAQSTGVFKAFCYQQAIDQLELKIEFYNSLIDQIGPDGDGTTSSPASVVQINDGRLKCMALKDDSVIALYDENGQQFDKITTSKKSNLNVYAIGGVLPGLDGGYLVVEAKQHAVKGQMNGTALGYVDADAIEVIDDKYCERVTPEMIYWPGG